MERRLGVAAALVEGRVLPGDVTVLDGRIATVGRSPAGTGGLAVPGFVDLQINGFAGVDFTTADRDGYRHALAVLAARGVTACVATIPTAAPDAYAPALGVIAEVIRRPPPGTRVLGAHLEGPFLNPERRGAHPQPWLRRPDPVL
ncbi:MAG: N-acetylglucosamine-6-phosphate deacetylase, partial [Acidimicrobiales bacterium]